MLIASLITLVVLGIVSIVFLVNPGLPSEARIWAVACLTAIGSGVVGYSLSRAGKSN